MAESKSTIRSRKCRGKLASTEEGRLLIKARNRDHKRRQRRNIKINELEERKNKYRLRLIPEVLACVDTKVSDHKQFLIRSLKKSLATHDEKQVFRIELLTFEIKTLAKKRQKKDDCLPGYFRRKSTTYTTKLSIMEKASDLAKSSKAGKSTKANDSKLSDPKSNSKQVKQKAIGLGKFRKTGKSAEKHDPKSNDLKSNEAANGVKDISSTAPTVHNPLYWNPSMEDQVDLNLNLAQYEEMAVELLPNINADQDVLSLLDPVRYGLSLNAPVDYGEDNKWASSA